jgi:hypothetical protein
MEALGLVDTSEEYISWRELFPEYSDEEMPGACLRGARYKEEITQKQLADMIGILQQNEQIIFVY